MFSITDLSNLNKGTKKVPKVPFLEMKRYVLGEKYDLSLVFVGNRLSKKYNREYRKIDKPTNILSFPIEKNAGEIFINLDRTEQEYKEKMKEFFPALPASHATWITFLFIHGLLHLKGFDHSAKMESKELQGLKHFGIDEKKHRHGNRPGNVISSSGDLRVSKRKR